MATVEVKMGGSLKGNRTMGGQAEPESNFNGRLGARLKSLRLKADKSVTDAAKALGVNFQSVYAYERGTRDMPVSLLPRYAQFLGVSLRQLLPVE